MEDRGRDVEPFPSNRRLVTAALRAGRRAAPMHGLLQLDVTDATGMLAAHDPPLSFTAFVIAAVAQAVAAHPAVHAYRNWRGQLVMRRNVDVSALVEIETPDGPFPLVHTVRDADARTVMDLTDELRSVKQRTPLAGHRWARWGLATVIRIPGLIGLMYAVLKRSERLRRRSGTVAVTSVGMFAGGGGFGIAPLTLMSLQVVVGGASERPWVVQGRVTPRRVLDLTVTIDHNVVDGGPAARFGAELRRQLETGAVLQPNR